MSLRGFHVVLIFLAILCSAGFWAWAYNDPQAARELEVVTASNLSGSLAIALFFYGIWFVITKRKDVEV
jgi:cbb3-type cytochrome oxidase subunit 3